MSDFVVMMETARMTLKLNQAEFARRLGYTPKMYSLWKTGVYNVGPKSQPILRFKIRRLLGLDAV